MELLGNIASVLSVLITGWVLFELKRLRSQYLLQARLPDLVSSLKSKATELSKSLGDFRGSQHDIKAMLPIVTSTLKNLRSKLDGEPKSSVDRLIKYISHNELELDEEAAWLIYRDLLGVVETLKQFQKDIKWRH